RQGVRGHWQLRLDVARGRRALPLRHSHTSADTGNAPYQLSRAQSANPVEVSVSTESVLEASCARYALLDQRLPALVPLLDQRLSYAETVALDCRAPIGAHADLRETSDVTCQLFRFRASTTLGGEVFAQTDVQALLRRYLATRENDLQRASLTDDARQPYR